MHDILNTWKQIFAYLKQNGHPLLLTHLIFTALGVIVFAPLIGLSSRLLLKFSGQTAIADQEIAYFLLSPIGMLALIVFAAFFIAILAFEQAVMMHIAYASILGQHTKPILALTYTAKKAHKIWLFTARLVIRILIRLLPALALCALIARVLISEYDINFYLTEKPAEFLIAAALIGGILLALSITLVRKLIEWSFSLPLILFGRHTPAGAFSESAKRVIGQRKIIASRILSWGVLSLLAGVLALGIIKLLGHWLIPLANGSLNLTVIILGGLAALWIITSFVITSFTSGAFAELIMQLYVPHRADQAKDLFNPRQSATKAPSSLKSSYLSTLGGIISIVLISAIIAGAVGTWLINGIPTDNRISVVAHRGAAGKAPENTLASFKQAIEDKTDWIELDVQENAEGEIVVVHDSDFMKLAGNPIKIWDSTLNQLADIDIGSWFDPNFSAERPPLLIDVLKLADGKARVVIELKYYGHDKQLEQRVIDIVEELDMVEEIAIMSLKYEAVQKVRSMRPGWKVGLLSATAIGDLSQLDTDFLAVAMGMASPGFVDRAHRAGRKVFVWTVNDPVSMSRMISLGVDGLITDEPEMARNVIQEREKMSTLERLLIHTSQLFGEPYVPKQYRDNSP